MVCGVTRNSDTRHLHYPHRWESLSQPSQHSSDGYHNWGGDGWNRNPFYFPGKGSRIHSLAFCFFSLSERRDNYLSTFGRNRKAKVVAKTSIEGEGSQWCLARDGSEHFRSKAWVCFRSRALLKAQL